MTNRKANFFILLAFGLLSVTSSFVSIIKDINIDISKAKNIIGKVTYADTRDIENVAICYTTYKRVFFFRLNNSSEKFAIYRSDEAYADLSSNIKPGDTVKIYYRPSISEYNIFVFQLEKGNSILANYRDYNKQVASRTGILLFLGLILSTSSVMWYKKFNLIKFMTRLVDKDKMNSNYQSNYKSRNDGY